MHNNFVFKYATRSAVETLIKSINRKDFKVTNILMQSNLENTLNTSNRERLEEFLKDNRVRLVYAEGVFRNATLKIVVQVSSNTILFKSNLDEYVIHFVDSL